MAESKTTPFERKLREKAIELLEAPKLAIDYFAKGQPPIFKKALWAMVAEQAKQYASEIKP